MTTTDSPTPRASRDDGSLRTARFKCFGFLLLFAALFGLPSSAGAQMPLAGITGVWRGTETVPTGTTSVEVIFFPNGTYSRAHRLGYLMTRDTGRFTIVQNWIHFNLQNWAPTEYKGRPLHWPTSETWVVTGFNGRVLETRNIHIERVR